MSDTQAIKVLIADDEPGMRLILRKMIARVEGYELVGEAQDGEQVLDMGSVEKFQAAVLHEGHVSAGELDFQRTGMV